MTKKSQTKTEPKTVKQATVPVEAKPQHAVVISVDQVIGALRKVIDPEFELDIWYLGLIYDINVDTSIVEILMTFTTPLCPVGPEIIQDVQAKVGAVPGVSKVKVKVVFDPPWVPPDELAGMMGFM